MFTLELPIAEPKYLDIYLLEFIGGTTIINGNGVIDRET